MQSEHVLARNSDVRSKTSPTDFCPNAMDRFPHHIEAPTANVEYARRSFPFSRAIVPPAIAFGCRYHFALLAPPLSNFSEKRATNRSREHPCPFRFDYLCLDHEHLALTRQPHIHGKTATRILLRLREISNNIGTRDSERCT